MAAITFAAAGVFIGQRATGCAAQAGTNGRTGAATDLVAEYRATGRAEATAQCGFGLVAVAGGNYPAGRTT